MLKDEFLLSRSDFICHAKYIRLHNRLEEPSFPHPLFVSYSQILCASSHFSLSILAFFAAWLEIDSTTIMSPKVVGYMALIHALTTLTSSWFVFESFEWKLTVSWAGTCHNTCTCGRSRPLHAHEMRLFTHTQHSTVQHSHTCWIQRNYGWIIIDGASLTWIYIFHPNGTRDT